MNELNSSSLARTDWVLLTLVCLILFGISLVSGRPLSMHEAVLPQTARAMATDFDFVVPKNGPGPWLESPPFPQWVSVVLSLPFGQCDTLFIVRLGNVLMALGTVLLTTWMASVFFGRNIALLSGVILATMAEFIRYSWLAEDEIYLCFLVTAAVASFVKAELCENKLTPHWENDTPELQLSVTRLPAQLWFLLKRFVALPAARTLPVFIALGMTNLAKGLIFGFAMAVLPMAAYLLGNRHVGRLSRYVNVWGWMLAAGIALAWPFAVYQRYPDVLELWFFDLGGRMDGHYSAINEPLWYYPVNLLWILAPWTLAIPGGFYATASRAISQHASAERFVWCWALVVPVVFSIPSGKHHHYMLHAMAPWAILASFGAVRLWHRIQNWPQALRNPYWSLLTIATPACVAVFFLKSMMPGPDSIAIGMILAIPVLVLWLAHSVVNSNPQTASVGVFGVLGVLYCFGHWYAGEFVDKHRHDAHFCEAIREGEYRDDLDIPVLLDLDVLSHRALLCQFYSADTIHPLHNLSWLADDRLTMETAYVLTQAGKQSQLELFGTVTSLGESFKTGGESSPEERLTLFELQLSEDRPQMDVANLRISPMQAMSRAPGPFATEQSTSQMVKSPAETTIR